MPHWLGQGPPAPREPAAQGAFLVQCNVCHVTGLVEALPRERATLDAAWPSLACVFTDDCHGHVWPDTPN